MTTHRVLLETIVTGATPSVGLAKGRVLSVAEDGDRLEIEMDGGRYGAEISLGCLIRPLAGDGVLVFRNGDENFVIQVLERTGPNYATLALPGRGNLALEGETISLSARQRLSLRSDRLDLQGRTLAFIADKTTWLSKALTAVVERFQMSARSHETSADTLIEKSVNRTAIVDQTDTLRAEMRAVKITGVTSETAQSKVITVADDLRMDGKRITMG